MKEATWYEKQLIQMVETLWYLQQRSRTLQEYRLDNHRRWDDEASRELNSRYFNPHEEDSQQILRSLQQQHDTLNEAHTRLVSAAHLALEANQLSQEISQLLDITQRELQKSYIDYDVYRENHAAAQTLLPGIHALIFQANNACAGIVSYG
ncbi:MAG: hypothetical protein KME30_29575 [Iphinoe sp. HA4291-MV1]|jgi:small-conductance mechanosensitive channel|nr:hypothetical protein [Iphinoe sp. HA4291-MV1]